MPNGDPGWHSAQPGEQTVRLLFDAPQWIRRIQLEFVEKRVERIQEFVLRWLAASGTVYRDVVRQQFVFSPRGANREFEDFQVDLRDSAGLELRINPDLGRNMASASLRRLRVG